MKWIIPQPVPPREWKAGDRRVRTKFAWWPTCVVSGDTNYRVWLEFYSVEEELYESTRFDGVLGYRVLRWKVVSASPVFSPTPYM